MTASVSTGCAYCAAKTLGPGHFNFFLDATGAQICSLASSDREQQAQPFPSRPSTRPSRSSRRRLGGRFIGICEPDYPALLRRAASAPPLIAVRGNLTSLGRPKIAIVGARNASAAGLSFRHSLRGQLPGRECHRLGPCPWDRRADASVGDRNRDDRGPCGRFGKYLSG
jgi:hypothetical protein